MPVVEVKITWEHFMSDASGDKNNRSVLETLFGYSKPVIAMMHLLPLPGRPLHDARGGMEAIVDALRRDLDILQEGGVDGLLFCNEGDRHSHWIPTGALLQ